MALLAPLAVDFGLGLVSEFGSRPQLLNNHSRRRSFPWFHRGGLGAKRSGGRLAERDQAQLARRLLHDPIREA